MHVSLFSWPIEWCGEGILKENHRFIPGVLNDILKHVTWYIHIKKK